jgi:probable HAF family extracellular repeat protein
MFTFTGIPTMLVCQPFVWEKGVMTPLPILGGNNGQAFGINDRRQIVGQAEGPNLDPCSPFALEVSAVVWRGGQIERVLPPFGGSAAVANAMNNDGDAVGLSGCNPTFYAVLWQHGKPINLGSLGGAFGNIPFDLNNKGQVVGQSDLPGDIFHDPFLWQDGVMIDLGNLPGLPNGQAIGINNRGQIVGFSQDANGDENSAVAVLWEKGTMTDLNTLIPADSPLFLLEAAAINDRGEIAGWGRLSDGEHRPFLLTPCNNDHASTEACEDRTASVSQDETRQRPIDFPENASKLIPRRLGPWYSSVGVPLPK